MSRFDYIKYDQESRDVQQAFKRKFQELEGMVNSHLLKAGRPSSLVLTHLEYAYDWTGKAVRDLQILRNPASQLEQGERGNE